MPSGPAGLRALAAALLLLHRGPVVADTGTVRIDRLLIEGDHATRRSVIERELGLAPGALAGKAEIEAGVQRLRNTGLFIRVDWSLEVLPAPEGPLHVLRVVVDERWTLMPLVRLNGGGGVLHLTLGLFDVNAFGRYVELGARYERLGTADGVALWYRDPRLQRGRWALSTQLSWLGRARQLYDDAGRVEGGFLLQALLATATLERVFRPWLRAGLVVSYEYDHLSLDNLPEAAREAQLERGGPPPDLVAPQLGLVVRLGELDRDDYRFDGLELEASLTHADPLLGAGARFTRAVATLRWFRMLPLKANVGARLQLGLSAGAPLQQRSFVGGLEDIRGFPDSRFRGRHHWLVNVEYRIPSVQTRWLVVQHVAFVDAARTADVAGALAGLSGLSAGIGVRLLSPRLYGFAARADLAVPLYGASGVALHFGGQQVF